MRPGRCPARPAVCHWRSVIVRRTPAAGSVDAAASADPARAASPVAHPPRRRWVLQGDHGDAFDRSDAAVTAHAEELGVGRLASLCLMNRGFDSAPAARMFLEAGLDTLRRPETLPDVDAAVDRIRRALRDGETICVWGDYDVDGVAGTSVLVRFLRRIQGERAAANTEGGGAAAPVGRVVPFIPERTGSGYGFHWPTMERLATEQGVTLFVSVDHGSTAVEPVRLAAERGWDVVIADHHEMAPTLPAAVAVVNPKRPDSEYGFASLCGTGVAMKLAWAIAQRMSPGARVSPDMRTFLLDALGTAVLGTVADVVPLRDENRVIVRHGLRVLDRDPPVGIRALLDVSRARSPLSASDVAFRLGPRLNAAGRMGSAQLALDLLLTDDPVEAGRIAKHLDRLNNERRGIERGVAEQAVQRVIDVYGEHPATGVVVLGDDWHHGVVGIVAARLVERFHVPAVVVSASDGVCRGSARSVPGLALHEALAACTEHLVAHGGHAMAAGLTMEPDRLEAFRAAFGDYVRENLHPDERRPRLLVDAYVRLGELGPGAVVDVGRLAPFGAGNPEPVFAARGVRVVGTPRRMGADRNHVAFHARDADGPAGSGGRVSRNGSPHQGTGSARAMRFVAFRIADRLVPLLDSGEPLDIAFTLQRNTFRGRDEVEGLVRDIRPSDAGGGSA